MKSSPALSQTSEGEAEREGEDEVGEEKRGRNTQMLMTSLCEDEETLYCVCCSPINGNVIWTMHRGRCRLSCEVRRETSF